MSLATPPTIARTSATEDSVSTGAVSSAVTSPFPPPIGTTMRVSPFANVPLSVVKVTGVPSRSGCSFASVTRDVSTETSLPLPTITSGFRSRAMSGRITSVVANWTLVPPVLVSASRYVVVRTWPSRTWNVPSWSVPFCSSNVVLTRAVKIPVSGPVSV